MYNDIQRFTEFDRNVLAEENAYRKYFIYLRGVIERVIGADIGLPWNRDEGEVLRYFLRRFLNTVECLQMKYLFDNERKMKIDQSDSSFPYGIELRYLLNDTERAVDRLEQLRPHETLLKDLVEWTYVHRKIPVQIQYELALRIYFERLKNPGELFFGYTPGSLSQISDSVPEQRYTFIYEWGTYEASINVPVLYQVTFQTDMQSQAHPSNADWYRDLKASIERATNIFIPLEEIAISIDRTCTTIYPKELKRLIVGPLHGKYSLDNNPVSEYLKTLDTPDAFALEVERECIRSTGEKKRKLISSKSSYQEFEVSHVSDETIIRKVSDYNELLFVPHATGQKLRGAPITADYVKKFKFISL